MREQRLESSISAYAKKKGLISVKNAAGQKGFPDRTFIGFNKVIFFVEFKKENGKLSAMQKNWREKLKRFGFKSYVIDTYEQGKKIIDEYSGE